MKYEVSIQKNQKVEPFEKNRDNIAIMRIQDKDGNNISGKIELSMSKSSMLELGKELIRDAFEGDNGQVFHFYPTRPGSSIMQSLGVFTHPNSTEPIIIDDIEPSIDVILRKGKSDVL